MQPLTVQIEGMTCGHCVEEVTETLKALNSVHGALSSGGKRLDFFRPQ